MEETHLGSDVRWVVPAKRADDIIAVVDFQLDGRDADLRNDADFFALGDTLGLGQSPRGGAAPDAAVRGHEQNYVVLLVVEHREEHAIMHELVSFWTEICPAAPTEERSAAKTGH